jgi:hypothetical protein
VTADPDAVPHSRAAGAALLAAALLVLGVLGVLVVEDRPTLVTLLIVFAVVSVPALVSALLGLRDGTALLRGRAPERGAAVYAALLALGHAGVVALSLRPGLDRRLDGGDLLGAATGAAGLLAGLAAAAVLAPAADERAARAGLTVRLVGALAVGALVLALLGLRAAVGLD